MGKIIASYIVKVVLREPDELVEVEALGRPPTIAQLIAALQTTVEDMTARGVEDELQVTVSAERTDI